MTEKRYYVGGEEVDFIGGMNYSTIEKAGYLRVESGDSVYNVVVEKINADTKQVDLLINNILYQVSIKTSLDDLLESMGMDLSGSKKLKEIKSPMPGRVLEFLKSPGEEVQPGEGILVLEAMKMENVIKSEGSGIVKALVVESESIVNKGDLLVTFE